MHAVCETPATSWRSSQTIMNSTLCWSARPTLTPGLQTLKSWVMNCTAATVPTVLEEEQPFTCAAHSHTTRSRFPCFRTAVRIETVNGPLTIISCYHRPQILLRENDITEIIDTSASVIAAGDFNCKHQVWGSRRANRNGRILLELADNTDMIIEAPPEPTYYDARDFHADILDIALVKNVPFQLRLHASQALDSDHVPVLMHIGDEANDITTFTCSKYQLAAFYGIIKSRVRTCSPHQECRRP
jgi:hypothetical protein